MSTTEPFDVNFCFPAPGSLENDRVKLVPFIPSLHLFTYFASTKDYPEIYKYLPWGPFPNADGFGEVFEERMRSSSEWLLFAVFAKECPSSGKKEESAVLAGVMGYNNASPMNLSIEIGAVTVFPPFQRTYVASNAVGLLLNYALNLPSDPAFPGLGLRRAQWQANYLNQGSIRLAQRMGYQIEGIRRWERVYQLGKEPEVGNGKGERVGDRRPGCLGRDSIMLGLCWDDWENGGRMHVDGQMERRA